MKLRRLWLGVYLLTCTGCRRVALRLRWESVISKAWEHDERCAVLCVLRADADETVPEVAR